ncbi:MAG TPA: acetoacetate--CoA ligase [Candidatus Binataceae bacterium]|nr:acetoacetate--CoA ligase [Candidatus Binataceae bacterium]
MNEKLWEPSAQRVAAARMSAFMRAVESSENVRIADYGALWRWSVDNREAFWRAVWKFCDVIGEPGASTVADGDRMPGARWFPDGRTNFAENCLRWRGGEDALVFWGEDKVRRRLGRDELYAEVSRAAQALRAAGVGIGDRVAGFLPNLPETVIAALAAAAIGAIWSSCSPDFGVEGVVDRFGQIEPRVLFVADGYFYNGRAFNTLDKVREMRARISGVERVVVVPYVAANAEPPAGSDAVSWADFVRPFAPGEIDFARLPFNHPLYILYSSGTTGAPKCIVHGAGGTLLQHLKEHQLHTDVRPGDRLFYFTTCGWMMWNWLVSGLASGATLLLYDGSPFHPHPSALFDFAEQERMTMFGTSAKYIDAIRKSALEPRRTHRLDALRTICSTGSPLAPEGFDYVYANVKEDVCLSSISGGTDLVSCFALGNPVGPVWRGELQCRGLGMRVEVWDEDGRPLREAKGELVCTAPFVTMPLYFWNDPDGSKYRSAYFERFPGVWCHGDWAELTAHDGMIIYGRSDATLNPGGVRIGTAELYRQVEQLDEVVECMAIGQDWDNDVRIVLFVRLREGLKLDDALRERIRETIRRNLTPRHVPARIIQAPDIPRTRNGKLMELAVRNLIHGRPVKNREAAANPEALDFFADIPELKRQPPARVRRPRRRA